MDRAQGHPAEPLWSRELSPLYSPACLWNKGSTTLLASLKCVSVVSVKSVGRDWPISLPYGLSGEIGQSLCPMVSWQESGWLQNRTWGKQIFALDFTRPKICIRGREMTRACTCPWRIFSSQNHWIWNQLTWLKSHIHTVTHGHILPTDSICVTIFFEF